MLLSSSVPLAQTLPINTQVSQIVGFPVVPQTSIAIIPQTQTVAQPAQTLPVMQPVIPQAAQTPAPVVPQLVQSVIQPVQSVIQPIQSVIQPVQSVIQPIAVTQPTVPLFISQPVPPKPLTPSPKYEKFIPPTPISKSLANDIGQQKVYQFYQYVPVQQSVVPMVNTLVQQGPAYSPITVPVQNVALSYIAPQYGTLSIV